MKVFSFSSREKRYARAFQSIFSVSNSINSQCSAATTMALTCTVIQHLSVEARRQDYLSFSAQPFVLHWPVNCATHYGNNSFFKLIVFRWNSLHSFCILL